MNMLYHPENLVLNKYADGQLEPGISLLVTNHINHCQQCRNYISQKTDELSNRLFEEVSEKENSDDAFNDILNLLDEEEKTSEVVEDNVITVNFHDRKFELPKSMAFVKDTEVKWKEFGKECGVAQLSSGENGGLFFIYVGPGETIPDHGHSGREYSYVVAGSYQSNGQDLTTGDFSTFTESDHHAPVATSDDGCLVISWVENRLNFLPGILSPLNRLFWWYLKRT